MRFRTARLQEHSRHSNPEDVGPHAAPEERLSRNRHDQQRHDLVYGLADLNQGIPHQGKGPQQDQTHQELFHAHEIDRLSARIELLVFRFEGKLVIFLPVSQGGTLDHGGPRITIHLPLFRFSTSF